MQTDLLFNKEHIKEDKRARNLKANEKFRQKMKIYFGEDTFNQKFNAGFGKRRSIMDRG